jgi:hypothetical protein
MDLIHGLESLYRDVAIFLKCHVSLLPHTIRIVFGTAKDMIALNIVTVVLASTLDSYTTNNLVPSSKRFEPRVLALLSEVECVEFRCLIHHECSATTPSVTCGSFAYFPRTLGNQNIAFGIGATHPTILVALATEKTGKQQCNIDESNNRYAHDFLRNR